MGKKGKSAEEKRQIVLGLYHEQLEPFNLKEIEKQASSRGVVMQSVKDVNTGLVDDGMVSSDKIGASNFFWSFPMNMILEKVHKKEALEKFKTRCEEDIEEKQQRIRDSSVNRSALNRKELMTRLMRAREENAVLSKQLDTFKDNDPGKRSLFLLIFLLFIVLFLFECTNTSIRDSYLYFISFFISIDELKRIAEQADKNRVASDRWTDNIWQIKSYMVKKRGMNGRRMDQILQINENFDYVTPEDMMNNKKFKI